MSKDKSATRVAAILTELATLSEKKGADYGTGEDSLANVRATQELGIDPWVGVFIRMNDKMMRIKAMIKNGKLVNESVEDSLRDIAVYAVIALVLREEAGTPCT